MHVIHILYKFMLSCNGHVLKLLICCRGIVILIELFVVRIIVCSVAIIRVELS